MQISFRWWQCTIGSLPTVTSWDLGPHQYLFRDNPALNKFNQPNNETSTWNLLKLLFLPFSIVHVPCFQQDKLNILFLEVDSDHLWQLTCSTGVCQQCSDVGQVVGTWCCQNAETSLSPKSIWYNQFANKLKAIEHLSVSLNFLLYIYTHTYKQHLIMVWQLCWFLRSSKRSWYV